MSDDDTRLDRRTALPEPLRALVTELPREVWETHPEFGALTRFWLDRHLMFRRLSDMLGADARALVDRKIDPVQARARLARAGQMLLSDLHMHHQIEDHHYFPVLAGLEPGVADGFDLLETDHEALDAELARFAEGVNAVLRAPEDADAAERAAEGIEGLARLLDRHLWDEEELVVPVILRHGERALPH